MHRYSFRCLVASLLLLFLADVSARAQVDSAAPAEGRTPDATTRFFERADLSRLVVVGDSLSSGFQSGSLLDRLQINGYASLIAGRARVELPLPLVAEPGVPNVLQLISTMPLVIAPAPGSSPGRTNPFVQPRNLAVPGAKVQDALTTRPNFPVDSLTDLVLGFPDLLGGQSRSQVELAEALQPTTIFLWIGNNDALGAATAADPARLTPQADFEASYRQVIDRLAATQAKLVVANIPDLTVIPFLTPAREVALVTGLPLAVIGPALGIAEGDFVTVPAFNLIPGILANPATGPLPGSVVLTASEVQVVRAAISNYNRFIASEVRRKRAALVDINLLLRIVDRFGYFVAGRLLTTNFLGGLFSLDAVHPTNSGYAIIGNAFITALNLRYFAFIRPIDVREVVLQDPLVPPFSTAAPGGVTNAIQLPPAAIEEMRRAFFPDE